MPSLCTSSGCAGRSWDDLFAYSTPRVVRVRDRRLGILQVVLVAVCMVYVIGVELIWNQGYRSTAADTSDSMSLALKTVKGSAVVPPINTTYCSGGYAAPPVGAPLPCLFLDEDEIVYPALENKAMFITTRLSVTEQALSRGGSLSPTCSRQDPSCQYLATSRVDYFVGGPVELATLKFAHAVYAPSVFSGGQDSSRMRGFIFGTKSVYD